MKKPLVLFAFNGLKLKTSFLHHYQVPEAEHSEGLIMLIRVAKFPENIEGAVAVKLERNNW